MLALYALLAAAQTGPALSSHDPQTVVAWLQSEGFRAKIQPSSSKSDSVGPYITTADSGSTIVISFLNCEKKKQCADVALSAAWDFPDGKGPSKEAMHKWNADRRFTKAYIDDEGDPVMEMDVLFIEGKLERPAFETSFRVFTDAIADFKATIGWEQVGEDEGAAPQQTASR